MTGNFANSQNSAQGELGQILRRQNWNATVILVSGNQINCIIHFLEWIESSWPARSKEMTVTSQLHPREWSWPSEPGVMGSLARLALYWWECFRLSNLRDPFYDQLTPLVLILCSPSNVLRIYLTPHTTCPQGKNTLICPLKHFSLFNNCISHCKLISWHASIAICKTRIPIYLWRIEKYRYKYKHYWSLYVSKSHVSLLKLTLPYWIHSIQTLIFSLAES